MAAMLGKLADAGVTSGPAPEGEDGPAYLWPECVDAWDCFCSLLDQWRDGVLPCGDVAAHLAATVDDASERADLYRCVRACAQAVSAVHAERRKALQQQG